MVVALGAAVALLLTATPAPVAVADVKCDRAAEYCEITDNPGGGGGSGGGGSSGGSPKYPSCGAFSHGIIVGRDEPPEASGDPLPDDIDTYVHATCVMGDGRLGWVWFPPSASPEQLARSLLARIPLRPITLGMAPKPGTLLVVGMPNWMWAENPSASTWGPVSASAGAMRMTVEVESVTWDMGDGSKVRCGKGTKWSGGPGGPSPTCGYVYQKQGHYTVTATSHWVAHWSGYGQAGDIPVDLSTTEHVEVGELQVIVVRGK
jgi:hypothetical protein